jgi:hypothetical protein
MKDWIKTNPEFVMIVILVTIGAGLEIFHSLVR